jgi:drug/metabolite transporter (DMT)-like permease
VVPMAFSAADVELLGRAVPWWLSIGELAVVAAAVAYLLGVTAARMLGSTVASFVGLTEVLFAVLFAWVLLGELPGPVQLAGGVLIVAGVVAVRVGELRRERRARAALAAEGTDFPVPAGIA